MISFKTFTESFSSHYDFEHKSPYSGSHSYSFNTHNNKKFHVLIAHHLEKKKPVAHVAFTNQHGEFHRTGDEGHHALKILSTVKHIIHHHLENHPHLTGITFDADKSEPEREQLYRHLTRHFTHKHTEKETQGVNTFHIRTKDIK